MLISTWLTAVRNRLQAPRVVKRRQNQKQASQASENLETRSLLTAPTLVAIRPNVGDILIEGETRNVAPRELTLQFNPGQLISSTNLGSAIQVTRGGTDRILNGVGDVPVTIGFVGIGDHPEEVVVRFAENLPDDVYRITLKGTGPTPLKNQGNEVFNNGVDLNRTFRLDLGAVVEGVVPQPVLRVKNINVVNVAQIADGDKLTITVGSATKVFEFNSTGSIGAGSDYALTFASGNSAATVATQIRTKISGAGLGVTVGGAGSQITLTGDSFTATVVKSLATPAGVTVADGGLVQRKNQVIVHFNEDDLDPALAQTVSFYRLINTAGTLATADDSLLVPSAVVYDAINNTAVLTFASDLPNATYALRIGSNSEQETLAGAIDIGTVLQNSFSTTGFIGGALGNKDVDLYKFNLTAPRPVTLTVTPASGTDLVLRVFDNTGAEVFVADLNGNGGVETLSPSLAAGTFYLGISSKGNAAYTAGNSASSTTGTTTGSYSLSVASATAFVPTDGNSSFGSATDLGSLGTASQVVNSQIESQNIPLPPYAGGNDEPGHRDIPAESHIGSSGTTPAVPGAVSVVQFNFADVYGSDPQGNILHNAITENQKQRAREIFELWSKKTGMVVQETAGSGIQIITGDLRAKAPMMPPNAASGLGGGGFALMNANIDWGKSEYGGAWFGVALHEIGHAIGLDHAYDLISVMGEGEAGAATPREPIFPTDHDIVHIQRLYQPDGTDIDMYQFNLPTKGKFSADILAERQVSTLDSVLRLYDASGKLLSQNDNYFSGDSFVGLDLEAGTYFIAVSSTGNDVYDPNIPDSGYGGTTDGVYQLRLNFEPEATNKLLDAPLSGSGTGAEFDGDADGIAGGEYEFFFQVANTIFVDKAAANGGNGALATPYNKISDAVLNVSAGSIIRVVGNGGTDGNELTASDAKPYLIGLTPSNAILQDGGTLEVPQGVTLMIDADAVIKLQAANIDAGSSAQGIDRSNGAIQILGVPSRPVYLTSYLNDALGGDSNGAGTAVAGGNWGGVVFRDDSDYEADGIFLNYVNKANITFGGGEVIADSAQSIFTPIHMVSARPTITFNTLSNNAKAAMSADPNSFDESGNRIGPEIHGNKLTNNTLNGLFVRVKTELGKPIDTLDVQARFNDDDIVHVVTENIAITGSAGGPLNGVARLSGRLEVDPGVVVKLGGSRIEALLGNSNFLAEGTKERPVIMTSILDDEYGIGGTFDTTNNLAAAGAAAGDWGGVFFNATSSGSIDHAIMRYGGGRTPIEGEFNEFNLIEIHQADVRVANSRLEFNANGTGVAGVDPTRNGRGTNGAAVIFVRGAQPIIVNNEFRENTTSHIMSIDVNSLNSFERLDRGRSTGEVQRLSAFDDNVGPLIHGNLMRDNGVNGMEVRGGNLTTQSVWDDTDMVHVLYDEVYVPNHHTYSGIRLQSRPTESLVVKLSGSTAGFTAGGVELDIDDRIGGTVQIIGSAGYPVVMTSLKDDTVGAGFDLDGFPVLDTNGDGTATQAAPGDWRSVKLEQYSNDRNVRVVIETEKALTGGQETTSAQLVGTLAPNEKSGDDNRPVGFEIHGHISPDTPGDVDVYSFKGIAGSEIWLDLDRTSSHLDSVLELVSAAGSVIARSDAGVLSGSALPMQKATALGGDYYTTNPMDEGFRVVLPGTSGAEGTYFVRVRSKNATTSGAYQLQVRVNQRDEIPGSTVRFGDLRFATDGIEMYGMPGHSPLTGEAGETTGQDNNGLGGAEFIGDLLSSDRNTISVSGNLSAGNDVDFFTFSVDYQFIQAIAGVNAGGKSWATIFDIDYADGLSRPDTILSVYDNTGKLMFVSRDSDVVDDQPAPGTGTGLNDLTRGSVGKLDAFLGTVALPEANDKRYYVAVSSNGRMPAELQQTFISNAADPLARLEPVNSVQRIVEDHIGFQGYSTTSTAAGSPPTPVPILPDKTEGLFDITTSTKLDTYVKPFTLQDVPLFGASGTFLAINNPFDGSPYVGIGNSSTSLTDIAMRPDGVLFGVQANSGTLRRLSSADASQSAGGDDGIPTYGGGTQDFGGMAFRQTPEIVSGSYELYVANNKRWDADGANNDNEAPRALWRLNADSGGLIDESTATGTQNVGSLPGSGNITGLAFAAMASNTLFAVDDQGAVWKANIGGSQSGRGVGGWTQVNLTNISTPTGGFTGITLGPQNVEDGVYANIFFASGADGNLYAFNQTGLGQVIFDTDADGVADATSTSSSSLAASTGLAFSPLDFNLWHPTLRRGTDLGHGINTALDNSRTPTAATHALDGHSISEAAGGASFYFGLEQWQLNPKGAFTYFQMNNGEGQHGVLNQNVQRELTTNGAIANSYNIPGGAQGQLVTNSFSLEGYKATDRPTVYFNYFLDTDGTNVNDNNMQDAARVYASADGGLTWELVATNNSVRNRTDSELPAYASHSATQTPADGRQLVQELFDNTGTWRQARIDLGKFGGKSDVKLRFDFTTSGHINDPAVDALTYGNINDRDRSLSNDHEGFYVDDIIVGIANRGEMATSASAATQNGAFYNAPADPSLITQHLSGEYQLEIRRGTEFGSTDDPLTSTFTVTNPLRATERFVSEYTLTVPTASVIQPGDSYVISNGIVTRTFVFNPISALPTGSFAVNVLSNASKGAVASALASAINGVSGFNVVATTRPSSVNSDIVDLTGAMNVSVTQMAAPADLTVGITATTTTEAAANTSFTVTRSGPTTSALTVQVSAVNPQTGAASPVVLTDGIATPAATITVTIPIGSSVITLQLDPTNDLIWDGTDPVLVRATAAGFNSITDIIDVTDNDTGALGQTGPIGILQMTLLQTTVRENGGNGGVTGYVTLRGASATDIDPYDNANPLVVTITSTDGSEVQTTSTRFVDGEMRAFFTMNIIDEFFTSGNSTLSITATASGYTSSTKSITVNDAGNLKFVDRLGDKNLHRQQGMVIIESNSIRNFSGFGVISDEAARSAGNQTNPGSVRNLATLNALRLIPGVTIRNNVVANLGTGGILFSGDLNNNSIPLAPVPFGKIINNTIYGGASARGVGIQVEQNASPTLMNNIIANTVTGIQVDVSSSSTVVAPTLFQGNGSNGTIGSDFIVLNNTDPLFVNPTLNNYYPAPGSRAVDSSLNSLADRPAFIAVKNPLGIPSSDLIAPEFDLFGQQRQDDPGQVNAGLGSDIFKDRGAIERADFNGPFASFTAPAEDNNTADLDSTLTRIHVDNLSFPTTISIDLLDTGIGVDDTQVRSAQFKLYQNGTLLVENVDYRWRYNPNNNRVYFVSVTTFPVDTRYSITVDNTALTGVRDLAGLRLQENQTDGTTSFTLLLTDGINNAPVNTIPLRQTMNEDTTLVFSTADGNAITMADQDAYLGLVSPAANLTAADGVLQVTLQAVNGVLTLGGTSGLLSVVGDGTNNVTISGTITLLNAALDGLIYDTAQDFNGLVLNAITITTSDLGNFGPLPTTVRTTVSQIEVDVLAVNDAPSFNPIAANSPPSVTEDAGVQNVSTFLTGISAGPADEVGQALTANVTILSENSSWTPTTFFAAGGLPTITISGTTATLSYTTALDVNGSVTVQVQLNDSQSTNNLSIARTFVITVTPLNDAPVRNPKFTAGTVPPRILVNGLEDESLVQNINVPLVNSFATGPATALDETSQSPLWSTTNYTRTSGNLVFDVLQIRPDGSLDYRARKDTAGTATFDVLLQDTGASGGLNVNSAQLFSITITIVEVNDAPVAVTGNYVIDEGYSLNLNAGSSYDVDAPFGDTLTYAWDINNDGDYVDTGEVSGSSPTRTITWAQLVSLGITAPQTRTIKLRVTDSRNQPNSSTVVNATLQTLIVDYGDAPDTFGTLKGSNGAAHTITGNLLLGTTRDNETDGQPGPNANLDGADEDGVRFPTSLERSPTMSLPGFVDVVSSGTGKLNIWLDLNGDGVFDPTTEHLNGGVAWNVVAGVNRINFVIPAGNPIGDSYMRFRLTSVSQPTVLPTGRANDGEVEDYPVKIRALQAPVSPVISLPVDFNTLDGQIPFTTDSTPTIAWSQEPANFNYELIVMNSAGQTVYSRPRTANYTQTSDTIPTSLPVGTYQAFVIAFNKAGTAALPSSSQFEVVKVAVSSPTRSINTSRPTIVWNHVPGTKAYTIEVYASSSNTIAFRQTVLTSSMVTPGQFTLPADLPLANYYTRIQAIDAADLPGDWSARQDFFVRTAPIVLQPPAVVITPLPQITWTPVTGAVSYDVQLFNLTDNVLVSSVTGIQGASWSPTSPLSLAKYRVVVTARGAGGFIGLASSPLVFTYSPVPKILAPGGRLSDSTPTFGWEAVPSANLYRLVVRQDFGSFLEVYRQDALTSTIHELPFSIPLGRYTFSVVAINTAATGTGQSDAISSRSLETTFAVVTPPIVLGLQGTSGPVFTTFLTRPTVLWTNPPETGSTAKSQLQVFRMDGPTKVLVVSQSNISGTSYTTPSLGLGTYVVRVRTASSQDPATSSDWSIERTFRVTVAPKLVGPTGAVTDSTPTLNWTGVTGGQTYQIEVTRLPGNVVAFAESGLNALNYTVPSTLPIGLYQFRVQARSAFGELSSWSDPMGFQIVGGPTLLGPASSTFNTRPNFSWTNMSGTVGGTESVVPVYDFRLDLILPNNVVQANFRTASGLTSTSYTLPTALPVGLYRAMVLARTSDTTSNLSNVVEFYVGGNPVVNPIGSTTNTTPTISWKAVDGASGYQIFIALDSNPTVPVVQQLGIGSLSYTPTVPLAKGKYRAWVRAVNASTGQLSGPAVTEAPSIIFTITDASGTQSHNVSGSYTMTLFPVNRDDLVSESTISMLPAFVSGSQQPVIVVSEQSVDSSVQLKASVPVQAENAVEVAPENVPQTDEILSQWDEQKWWDAAPVAVIAADVARSESQPVTSASSGILGALLALAPWSLRRRKKDESAK